MQASVEFVSDFGSVLSGSQPLEELWVTSAYASLKGVRSLKRMVQASVVKHAILGCNGDTEWRALQELSDWGVKVQIMPDPPEGIFHPKCFYGKATDGAAWVVIGSANLTDGGLRRNIEAGVRLKGPATLPAIKDTRQFFGDLIEGAAVLTPALLEQVRAAQEEIHAATRSVAASSMGALVGLDPNQAFRLTPLGKAVTRTVDVQSFLHYIAETLMQASYKMVIFGLLLQAPQGRLPLVDLARKFGAFYRLLGQLESVPERPGIAMRDIVGKDPAHVLRILKDAPREALTRGRMVMFRGQTVEIARQAWDSMTRGEREVAFGLVLDRLQGYYRMEVGVTADFAVILGVAGGL